MGARMYHDADADLTVLEGATIAILGYGSQGHAHAQNLRDSGLNVLIGLPGSSKSRESAEQAGFEVLGVGEAVAAAQVIMVAIPDTAQRAVYDHDIAPNLVPGQLLLFAHGFNIRFELISPPPYVDLGMVAPKGPGHLVRSVYLAGGGVPALFAVGHDATGSARARTLAYAKGIGATRAGVLETTFAEETETDLFGEQALLCGGVTSMVKAAFETLVEAGYQPELAYFETMHELKLITDLMYRGGLSFMRFSVSDTAEYGDYVSGPRVTEGVKAAMRDVLSDIRSGQFAARWVAEYDSGGARFAEMRAANAAHKIEIVGAALRAQMPFLDPVTIVAGQAQASASGAARPAAPAVAPIAAGLEAAAGGQAAETSDPERIARLFHENYERLAPGFGYETRRDSAVPWAKVPERNRTLMIATVAAVMTEMSKAQAPAIDAAHLARQREFSLKNFGPGRRTGGVIKHIRKELVEIEADPTDLAEWADVVILDAPRAAHLAYRPGASIVRRVIGAA